MSNLLEQLRSVIEAVVLSLGYGGLGLVMFIENIFPPIPSELVLPFAGFLVSQERFSFVGVLAASTIGSLVGALVLYYLGAWWGETGIRGLVRRYGRWALVDEADFDKVLKLFRRHDRSVVFWARFLPVGRSLISIPAGIARMPLASFLFFTSLGTLIWNALLSCVGWVLGHNWARILGVIDRYELLIALLVMGLALIALTRRVSYARRSAE